MHVTVELVILVNDDLIQLHVLHAELETDTQVRGAEQNDKVSQRLPEQPVGQRPSAGAWLEARGAAGAGTVVTSPRGLLGCLRRPMVPVQHGEG